MKTKKIIISEAQKELIDSNLNEEISKKRKILLFIASLIVSGYSIAMINSVLDKKYHMEQEEQKELIRQAYEQTKKNELREDKIQAVKEYMAYAAKNQGFSPDKIKVSPEAFVDNAEKYSFDLPMLLAQAHLESCFGLTRRAQKTNSIFSIGAYDNGKNHCVYNTQDESIPHFIKIVQNDYLSHKSLDDLLKKGGYTNHNNDRYASDKNYEWKVNNVRNRIIKNYPILTK